jgi:hypothetical protein
MMTTPQFFHAAYEKLKKVFGKTRADQLAAEAKKENPLNGVAAAEALAKKAGITRPEPTGNFSSQARRAPSPQVKPSEPSAELKAAQIEIADLKARLAEATTVSEKAIARQAMEICASQGNVPPISFRVKGNPATGPVSLYDRFKEIQKSNVLASQEFWKQNKAAIIAELDSATA